MRPVPVLCALVVLLSVPGAAVTVPTVADPTATPAHQRTSLDTVSDTAVLALDGDRRSSFVSPSLDVATAVQIQRTRTVAELETRSLETAVGAQDDRQAARELLLRSLTRIELRISDLIQAAITTREAYMSRSISTTIYINRLIQIQTEANRLETQLTTVREQANEVPRFTVRPRVNRLKSLLVGFQGPVRTQLRAALRGAPAPPDRIYLESSANGLVLSMFLNNEHIREAYRLDRRNLEGGAAIGINEAIVQAEQHYNDSSLTGITGIGGGAYQITAQTASGRLVAYLDGVSERIFYEVQYRRLPAYRPDTTVSKTQNGVTLTVNRTFAGGPLRISVRDVDGDPVVATIQLGDRSIGETTEGQLWTLAPRGGGQITAVTDTGNVSVRFRPVPLQSGNETATPSG
ncbi:MAG: hypothetical protein SVG88_08255 [Halobacteriales archaeon]|nr:hypothetical protein [Halobacteriales archaeon]